jgi:dihydrofolate reductase
MSKLVYITNTSLDGYIEDEAGNFDWTNPNEIHQFITELIRPIRTHLYGRRLYETMAYWDAPEIDEYPPQYRDFARVWQSAEKVVFSRTLTAAATRNTRLQRDFNVEAVRKLKRESQHDVTIGGAELASQAIEAQLVDECHLFIHPVIVGRGKPAFQTALQVHLELLDTRRFDTGVIYLRYRTLWR